MKTKQFNDRMREAMQLRKVKQSELARRTGISSGTINNWLKGKYEPKQDKVYVLAQALSVSPVWLMGYDVEMTPAAPDFLTADGILIETQSADEIAFLNRYTRADEKTKKIIRQLLDMEE